MPGVLQKLNLKEQRKLLLYNVPDSFERELESLNDVAVLRDAKAPKGIEWALAFVQTQKELDRLSKLLAAGAAGDAILWFAYPKGTSQRFRCEFNRDNGFDAMRAAGFDSVRMVAIDQDWSALRFRAVRFIKNSTRAQGAR